MLHPIDIIIIGAYLLAMMVVGILSRGRQRDTHDYFTSSGGFSRALGSLLVGLSIAASFFSGISFLAYPSLAYSRGISILLGLLLMPVAWYVVACWFLPRFLRKGSRAPYDVIESRFGYPVRAVAAGMYILLRIAWMGTLIYAPTVAVMAAGKLPPGSFWIIVMTIGFAGTIYTAFGGIRGVIVTDAIQFVVVTLGVILPIVYAMTRLPVSLSQGISFLHDTGRLHFVDLSFSLTKPLTLWSILIGYTIANLAMYMGDQMSLQRYLAARDLREARRAFAVNFVGVVIVVTLLILVGLVMAVWYGTTGKLPPKRPDDVFPFFVATQLPVGAPGMIFAAILAATMSTMTSGINALAGTITLDLVARSKRLTTPRSQLLFARCTSVAIGLSATFTAGLVSKLGTIFDIAQKLSGVFSGPLLVCIVLSLSRARIRPQSMIAGMIVGSALGWLAIWLGAYALWIAPASAFSCLAVAWIGSLGTVTIQSEAEETLKNIPA